MTAVDRYSIKYNEEVKHFDNHTDAVVYVLSLPSNNEKVDIKKYGSWQKVLIHIIGEVNEIQRLVKVVAGWEKKTK